LQAAATVAADRLFIVVRDLLRALQHAEPGVLSPLAKVHTDDVLRTRGHAGAVVRSSMVRRVRLAPWAHAGGIATSSEFRRLKSLAGPIARMAVACRRRRARGRDPRAAAVVARPRSPLRRPAAFLGPWPNEPWGSPQALFSPA